MGAADRFQIRMNYHDSGYNVDLMNVFHYLQTAGSGGATQLKTAFANGVLSYVTPMIHENIEFGMIEVINLDDPTDFDSSDSAQDGDRTGECLPPFITWGFRLNRTTRATRHGYKRFSGVTESDTVGGGAIAGLSTAVADLEDALGATLSDAGTSSTWDPVIMKITRENPGETPAIWSYTPTGIASVAFQGVTSQNTRKN